ncbi:uncharacterized protein LOC142330415 [Lycorma delicatula]|uniref:uncharacterized protein LOC142330415 n=1 Tax=Lycorma delicatula TaxID=130591 RepID=UPI003F513CC0
MFNTIRLGHSQLIRNSVYLAGSKFYSSEISPKDVQRLQRSWKEAEKKADKIAKTFFKGLFEKHPDYAKLFSKWGECPEDLIDNEEFIKEHGIGNVLVAVGGFIKKMDDPCEANQMAKAVGKLHIKYCLKPEHFNNAKPIFLKSVKKVMGKCIDCETGLAWEKAANIIFDGLIKGLK